MNEFEKTLSEKLNKKIDNWFDNKLSLSHRVLHHRGYSVDTPTDIDFCDEK